MHERLTNGRLAAFVFEGGGAADTLSGALASLREAMTLDVLERLRAADLGGPVVLATNRPELATAAEAAGFPVHRTPETGPFQFGDVLAELVRQWAGPPCTAVLCLGGAAAPLADAAAWREGLVGLLGPDPEPHVLANNPQSPDVVAFAPPRAVFGLGPVPHDNALAWALRESGLPRLLLPPIPAYTFDIDTPIDAIALHVAAGAGLEAQPGPRTRAALTSFAASSAAAPVAAAMRGVLDCLQRPLAEVGLIGRVGTPAIDHVNKLLPVRLRVFSEERGMKGLGREERGEVRSLLGHLLDEVGAERFFDYVTSVCDACLIDVRVLLGHWRLRLSDEDRARLDLFQPPDAEDDRLAQFVAAARRRFDDGFPLLLGGHSLVAGGLQLLAEAAAAEAAAAEAASAAAAEAREAADTGAAGEAGAVSETDGQGWKQ